MTLLLLLSVASADFCCGNIKSLVFQWAVRTAVSGKHTSPDSLSLSTSQAPADGVVSSVERKTNKIRLNIVNVTLEDEDLIPLRNEIGH